MSAHLDENGLTEALEGRASDAVRAHLSACGACAARVEAMKGVFADARVMPEGDPEFLAKVLKGVAADEKRPTLLWVGMSVVSMALVLFVSLRVLEGDGRISRGGGEGKERVKIGVKMVKPREGELVENSVVPAMGLVVRVEVSALPGKPEKLAVYVRDSAGRVTWLLPQWGEGQGAPACVGLSGEPQVIAGTTELPALATGPAVVRLVRTDGPCDVGELDGRVERGELSGERVVLINVD